MSRTDQDKGFMVELVGFPGRGELKEFNTPDRFHDTDEESIPRQAERDLERAIEDDRLELNEHQQSLAYFSRQPYDW